MKKGTSNASAKKSKPMEMVEVADYERSQTPEYEKICKKLRVEINATLPKAAGKIWHSIPVWFIGENPVVGYNVTAKNGVSLLFWNGQAFDEPALKMAGKFRAAQIQFQSVEMINTAILRRWLKKAGKDIWDYQGFCK